MKTTTKVRVPKELITKLYDLGAIKAGGKIKRHDGMITRFDLQLDDLIPTNREVRLQMANVLCKPLRERYNGETRSPRFGLVDVSPPINKVVTSISNKMGAKGKSKNDPTQSTVAECPTASIATRMHHNTAHTKIYGRVIVGYSYVLVDDILWRGKTIADAFGFWYQRGYPVDYILIFCDAQAGGLAFLRDGIKHIAEQIGASAKVTIDCLTTRTQVLDILQDAGRISPDIYRAAMEGAIT